VKRTTDFPMTSLGALPPNSLASMLRSPETTFGTCMLCPTVAFANAAASSGQLDFVFIDTEHVPLDRGPLSQMCLAYRALGLPPLVRIPRADAALARQAIDAGACGVVAAYMETVEQVEELRSAVKLRPLQGALLHKALSSPAALARSHPKTARRVREQNAELALVVNIESQAAIDNLDAILAVPGVDCLLVGPHDLSFSLGVPEDFESETFQQALKTIFAKARAANVGAAIHQGVPPTTPGMTPADAARWIGELGCNVYVHAADLNLFVTQLSRDLAAVREATATATVGWRQQGGKAKHGRGKPKAVPSEEANVGRAAKKRRRAASVVDSVADVGAVDASSSMQLAAI
jgi:2-keto-3-deoxy-L-rhamnonate aldolase RhmA